MGKSAILERPHYCHVGLTMNSPFSVQSIMKTKLAEDGKETTTQRRMMMENGHPGVAVDEAAIRRGENPYTKYFQQQGEQQLPSDSQVRSRGSGPDVRKSANAYSPSLFATNSIHRVDHSRVNLMGGRHRNTLATTL